MKETIFFHDNIEEVSFTNDLGITNIGDPLSKLRKIPSFLLPDWNMYPVRDITALFPHPTALSCGLLIIRTPMLNIHPATAKLI